MSTSFVLASLRGSTYRSVRLASSLAAALLGRHFERPAWHSAIMPYMGGLKIFPYPYVFLSREEEGL